MDVAKPQQEAAAKEDSMYAVSRGVRSLTACRIMEVLDGHRRLQFHLRAGREMILLKLPKE